MILGLLLGSLLQLIFPLLTQAVVDTGIGGKDIGFIWLVLLAQLMLLLSRTAIDFIRDQILIQISTRLNISLVSDFFSKLMRLPMRYFDSRRLGELLQRMDDHHRVDQFLTYSGLSLSFSLFTFVAYGVVLAIYDIWIFAVFLLGALLYAGWILIFLKRRKKLDYDYFKVSGHNHNVTYQLLNGMQEIKLQGCEAQKRWEWEEAQADIFKVSLKFLKLEQVQKAGSILITEGTNILITIIAATAVIHGDMTLGMMLAVQYIIGQLNSPVEQLIQYIYSWQDVSFSLDRIGDIHDEAEEEGERSLRSDPSEVAAEQSIVIKGLTFRYEPEGQRDVLSDINLTIPNGKVTAIVGASGSGKTTLIKLMLGFYEPLTGQIEVGGIDLKRFSPSWWRGECGVVMQEGYLFTDSIARNIALSDAKPTLERIRYAAQVANIAEEIESWPLGYNTVIGQEGQGLSEGQRQQILIARMVYREPKFVFLDEATNALDATNERVVTERLAHFCKGKTAVVVAHRLSTIRHADQIVVMDRGRIAEIGNHERLMALKGKYFGLVNNQMNLDNDGGEKELGATW